MGLARQAVLNNVNQDTFGDYLDVASSRRLQRLEAKCIDFLLANFEKVRFPVVSVPHRANTPIFSQHQVWHHLCFNADPAEDGKTIGENQVLCNLAGRGICK